MIANYAKELAVSISVERLESYRPKQGTDLEMIVNYYWNLCLCEALYPNLNAAEIALRNSIHTTLTNHYQNEFWFDDGTVVESVQWKQVREARSKLRNRVHAPTAGQVVAELSFGFWVGMLNRPYERKIWSQQGYKLLRTAFPHAPRRARKLWLIRKRFAMINTLRNRAFHYEPVWNRTSLAADHASIQEAIGWISPAKRDSVLLFDRFPDVLQHGTRRIETNIKGYLEIE